MDILPYSGISFFILTFLVIGFIYLFKKTLQKIISYKKLIFIVCMAYLLLFLPYKEYLIGFLLYAYLIYYAYPRTTGKQLIIIPALLIALPMTLFKLDIDPFYKIIGISYITFRTVQMIVDQKNYGTLSFIEFVSFLTFPPSLLAGPIDRSYRFKSDMDAGYSNLTHNQLFDGWNVFIVGVLFKFVFAELINLHWLSNTNTESTQFIDMANNAYAYSVYFYFDFAGYSAMAVGIGKMLGINIPVNFNKPFLAQNPQDFWRRFHITLGSWLTDYIFKPMYKHLHRYKILKGRRLLIQNLSIIATFLLMGMWNGLQINYIVSGLLFGLFSATHNAYTSYIKKNGKDILFGILPKLLAINLKRLMMINAAVFALYFFSGRVPL
jgi:membrane protein involved in D-alanine export